jgi:hypothetical protein
LLTGKYYFIIYLNFLKGTPITQSSKKAKAEAESYYHFLAGKDENKKSFFTTENRKNFIIVEKKTNPKVQISLSGLFYFY